MRNAAAEAGYQVCTAISASDTVNIATGVTDAVIFTTTGNAVLVDVQGNTTTITGAPVGLRIPLKVVRVNATGLTATLSALYY